MKAVMLVGGEGTRLRPLTDTMPKHLLSVGNRPFLEHVMSWLSRHGVTEAIFTTGYQAAAFKDFDKTHGVKLSVVVEETLLGTAGAVRNVLDQLDDTFLVINGDILTTLDLTDLVEEHRQNKADVTISLSRVTDPSAYGLVPTDDEGAIEGFIEKPEETEDGFPTDWINAGTYALERSVVEKIPPNQHYMFERGLFPRLVAEGAAMYGFQSECYWLDVGTPEKYLKANAAVLNRSAGLEPPGRRSDSGAWIDHGAAIHPSAILQGPCAVGAGVVIGQATTVGAGSCVSDRAVIGDRTQLNGSLVHRAAVVGNDVTIADAIVGEGAQIGSDVVMIAAFVGSGATVGDGAVLSPGVRINASTSVANNETVTP